MFVAVFIIFVLLCIYTLKREKRAIPPFSEGAWPLVGHTFTVIRNPEDLYKLLLQFSESCLRQGGAATFSFVATYVYGIADPADAYEVLNSSLQKDVIYDYFKPWIGEGLISASETIWKRHRKLLNPTFSQAVLDSYLSEFNKQARLLVINLEVKAGTGKFNHAPYLENAALETICATAMGIITDEKDIFLRDEYLKAKSIFSHGLVQRAQTFWLHSEFIYSLSSLKKRQEDIARTLHGLTNKIIAKRKAEMTKKEENVGKRLKPFMELLLDMEKEGVLNEKEVQEEVDTFTFAGSDTLSITLTIALLTIGSYPDVERKIVEELREVFQGSDRDVKKEDLLKLKYLEAVVKETLRLFPAVPVLIRTLEKDVKIKNYTLPSGSRCFISVHGVNRHSSWGPDAEQFRPERWLDPAALPSHHLFASFGFGKRKCIGINFAIMSAKTTLAHVLRHYRVFGDITQLVQRIEVVARPVPKDYISIERRVNTAEDIALK